MFLLFCYMIAIVPIAIAAGMWFFSKKIVWWESLATCAIGIFVTLIFHILAVKGMTDDIETWSGQVTESVFVPAWKEYYEEAIYRTEVYTTTSIDSKGRSHTTTHTRRVFSHWESRTRWHSEHWYCTDTVNGTIDIEKWRHDDITKQFGNYIVPIAGRRHTGEHNSRMIAGDPNDYHSQNKTNYIYPTTAIKHWENRVKAAPSVFSYQTVPENVNVFEYPKNNDLFASNRTVGKLGVSGLALDQLNSIVGPMKHANVIIVGFDTRPMAECNMLEAKWIGGKKNDIVICVGGSENVCKPTWCRVFSWSESDLCKENLQSIVLKHGMTNDTLPLIKDEIMKNYTIRDWSKFDYLTVEVPFSYYIWLIIIVTITTGSWIIFAYMNDQDKENKFNYYNRYN